jgi:GNAT superfamily N-acetyltransferase
MDISIHDLYYKQEYCDEVGTLICKEWSSHPEDPEKAIYRVKHCICEDRIPKTFIALDRDTLVGFVALWVCDDSYRQDLLPWYSALYIKPEYRNRGISNILDAHIKEEAKKLGFNKIYLKTNLVNFYEKKGWIYIEDLPFCDEKLYYFDLERI